MHTTPTPVPPQAPQGWDNGAGLFRRARWPLHYFRAGRSLCGKNPHRKESLTPTPPEGYRLCRKCHKRATATHFGYRGPTPGKPSELQRQAADRRALNPETRRARGLDPWNRAASSICPPGIPKGQSTIVNCPPSGGDNRRRSVGDNAAAARARQVKGTNGRPAPAGRGTKPKPSPRRSPSRRRPR